MNVAARSMRQALRAGALMLAAALATAVLAAGDVSALGAAPLATAGAPRRATLIDDRGVVVAAAPAAQRIVTLAPSLTELAFAAGAGDRVVGVASLSDHPPAAARLPVVAGPGRIDVERLLELAPDLVLAWPSGNPARDLARLERLGLRVFAIEPRRLDDLPRALRAIGALAGTPVVAEAAAATFERGAAAAAASPAAPARVFFEIWHDPLVTVSDAHLIGDLVARCGGANVFGGSRLLTPRISREALYAADPDVIVSSVGHGDRDQARRLWSDMALLRAVRDDRVQAVDADLVHRQGPRVIEGLHALCRAIAAAQPAR
jgi:iron complex transport system substrate-binding protein